MKNITLFLLFMICVFSCNSNQKTDNNKQNTDSTLNAIQSIDSILHSGNLLHIDYYPVGEMTHFNFTVVKIENKSDKIHFLEIDEQYYNYGINISAYMMPNEIKYFIEAIDSIKTIANKKINHHEEYVYNTKGKVALKYHMFDNEYKSLRLSADYSNYNAESFISETDLDTLRIILSKAQEKLQAITK